MKYQLCLLVHKALVGHALQYIADLIRPVADLPSRASLRTAHSGDLYVPRTCRRFGDRAFAVVAPRMCNSLVYLLTSNFTGRRQHLSNAILKLFYLTGASLNILNDSVSVMHYRSFSRKCNINTLVTVTMLPLTTYHKK